VRRKNHVTFDIYQAYHKRVGSTAEDLVSAVCRGRGKSTRVLGAKS